VTTGRPGRKPQGHYLEVDEHARKVFNELAQSGTNGRISIGYAYQLMRAGGIGSLEELFEVGFERVDVWLSRGRRFHKNRRCSARQAAVRDLGKLKLGVALIAGHLGWSLPAWAQPTDEPAPGPTNFRYWEADPWFADLKAINAHAPGTQRHLRGQHYKLLALAHQYRVTVGDDPSVSFAAALLDRDLIVPVFKATEMEVRENNRKRGRDGTLSASTLDQRLESVRPLFMAAALPGAISEGSMRALTSEFGEGRPLNARRAGEAFRSWKEDMLADIANAGVTTDSSPGVDTPADAVVKMVEEQAFAQYNGLLEAHEARGLTTSDFARWREWDPAFRLLLMCWFGFRCLYTGGLRAASLNALQPGRRMTVDGAWAAYSSAIRFGHVIVKRIRRKKNGTNIHRNFRYGDEAPTQDASTWTILGPEWGPNGSGPLPIPMAKLYEMALHSTGQCSGKPLCDASEEAVLRRVRLRQDGKLFSYHVEDPLTGSWSRVKTTKTGEWLAMLRAIPEHLPTFTTLWWSQSGEEPLLMWGMTGRLNAFIDGYSFTDGHMHLWRHFAFHYLTRIGPFKPLDAARLIHMDLQTAVRIYDNPNIDQVLGTYFRPSTDAEPTEVGALRARVQDLETERGGLRHQIAQLEHRINYAEIALGRGLPLPPTQVPAIPAPPTPQVLVANEREKKRARTRRVPMGSSALTTSLAASP
jgi:hypothetical protein